jgi:hypothetical protein
MASKKRVKIINVSNREVQIREGSGLVRVFRRRWYYRTVLKYGDSFVVVLPKKLITVAQEQMADITRWSKGGMVRIGLTPSGKFVIEWADQRQFTAKGDVKEIEDEDLPLNYDDLERIKKRQRVGGLDDGTRDGIDDDSGGWVYSVDRTGQITSRKKRGKR